MRPKARPSCTTTKPQREPRSAAHPDDTIFRAYLRDMAGYELMTAEEEMACGLRIMRGDQSAVEEMVLRNLRLVIHIAGNYGGNGVDMLDLINEGNLGLMRAAQRFDPTRGAKFSTYASFWVKQAIKRALTNGAKVVRIPCGQYDRLARVRKAQMTLLEIMGREATPEELSQETGYKLDDVNMLLRAGMCPMSLDDRPKNTDSEGDPWMDRIEDTRAAKPDKECVEGQRTAMLMAVVDSLPRKVRDIMCRRFGLDGYDIETLDSIGESYNVTRERIRQIEKDALKRMRRLIELREMGDAGEVLEHIFRMPTAQKGRYGN